jgi:hypothetical protein
MTDPGSDIAVLEPPVDDDLDEIVCTAEIAECTCPEFCERDHDTD